MTNWYAVHVRSNCEHRAQQCLNQKGVECYLPTYITPSIRSDRTIKLHRPLFPGYLFVSLRPKTTDRVSVLQAKGVVSIVSFGNRPATISVDIIDSLKILTGVGDEAVRPHPLVAHGKRVKVMKGPFRGAIGILNQSESKKFQLVVEVEFLGRAVSVPISVDQVSPVFD